VTHLPDGTWPVAFNRGDIFSGASGIYMNSVHVFTEDRYAAEDIEALAAGDSIVVEGETIEVKSVDFGGDVAVNGGLDGENGVELRLDAETGFYYVSGYNDLATYTDHGVTTLMIDDDTSYTDVSDPTQNPVMARGAEIVDAIAKAGEDASFDQYNTRVTIENGRLAAMSHLYTP